MTLLYLLTYGVAVVFLAAVLARFIRLSTTPVHLRWELYPVAHEGKRSAYGGSYLEEDNWWTKKRSKNILGEMSVMLPEIFLLKGIWEHNRKLWVWTFCLHYGLYWLIGTAGLMILLAILDTVGAGRTQFAMKVFEISRIIGMAGYILGTFGALSMFIFRSMEKDLRKYSSFAIYFNLIFLGIMFITGLYSAVIFDTHFQDLFRFFKGLLTGESLPLNSTVVVHLTVVILFALYLPFTHMTHFFTKWFTYHAVRWNDEPNLKGSKLEKSIVKVLQYPVTWSAKHIGADGVKNWAEIATSEVPKDEK